MKARALLFVVCFSWIAVPVVLPQKPGQPEIRISSLERRVHDLVNAERKSAKLTSLRFDEELSEIARAHSEDMARRKFFDHINPDGRDPSDRGKRAGYVCQKIFDRALRQGLAENLFQGNLYDRVQVRNNKTTYDWNTSEQIARQSVQNWMNSPGHRRNILERDYDRAGIGVAISKDDKVYITQLFC